MNNKTLLSHASQISVDFVNTSATMSNVLTPLIGEENCNDVIKSLEKTKLNPISLKERPKYNDNYRYIIKFDNKMTLYIYDIIQ